MYLDYNINLIYHLFNESVKYLLLYLGPKGVVNYL